MYQSKPSSTYDPKSERAYPISRSKIDLFLNCARCFYLELRFGIKRPPSFPFNLNNAVDLLLKKEFDTYRFKGKNHPLLIKKSIDAFPTTHPQLMDWRNSFVGVRFHHRQTNLIIYGGIDDLWRQSNGKYVVVDYKATATRYSITELNKPWHIHYKRQIEIYQWLLRQNGFPVSSTGYFLYCNGDLEQPQFDQKLHFKVNLIPYHGDDSWVEETIFRLYECLQSDQIPSQNSTCEYCLYTKKRQNLWFTPDSE